MGVEDVYPHRFEDVNESDEPGEVGLMEVRRREMGGEQGKALRESLRFRRQFCRLPSEPRQVELGIVESGFPQFLDLFREWLAAVCRTADAHVRTKRPGGIRLAARPSCGGSRWPPTWSSTSSGRSSPAPASAFRSRRPPDP